MSPGLFIGYVIRQYRRSFNRENYLRIRGCASRSDFWCFFFVNLLAYFFLYLLALVALVHRMDVVMMGLGVIAAAFFLVNLPPAVGLSIRRFHDAGFSGWLWALLMLVPFAAAGIPTTPLMIVVAWLRILSAFAVLVICLLPAKDEGNHFRIALQN